MSETMDSLERLLGDDFTHLRPLNEDGGMSRLFRAHKRSLNVDVVIKQMPLDPKDQEYVQREARIMTGLRHQFLPRIFDFKSGGDGWCYTIMEWIPGCTLRQYIQRKGAVGQKQALFWMKQLCQAAAYMHAQKPPVIHSDIKPENIMITPGGDICLIDFNASLEMQGGGAWAVGATLGYAAPEQYNVPLSRFGDPARLSQERRAVYTMAVQARDLGKVTERSDLYAIGAVAYYMLTGYNPAPWNQPLIPLERYDIVLGDALGQVIGRCMARNPAERFSSAKETLRALQNLAQMDRRYRNWRRSCRAAALAVGAGLILSAFAALWGWMSMGREAGEAYNALVAQAQECGDRRDYERQQELLLQAAALDRERPEAYAHLGALLYRLGDYSQAVSLLSQTDPDRTGGLPKAEAALAQGQIQYVLACCYYQLQEYEKALECGRMAVYFCPEEAAYQRDLAVYYSRCGYPDQAQEALERLESMDVQPGDGALVSGEIAYAGGRYEEALALLSGAVQDAQDSAVVSRAALEAAQCCRQLGGGWIDSEIAVLRSACRRLEAAESAPHTEQLAEALIRRASYDPDSRQESWEEALACLEDLTARGQGTFAVRQNRALVLEYLDRFQDAEAALLELCRDFPQDYRPAMRLALLYADWESGKPPEERDYAPMKAAYRTAAELCTAAETDPDMARLEEWVRGLGG